MTTTPRLVLDEIVAGLVDSDVLHNEALRRIDAHLHLNVLDRDLSAAPTPTDGECYIVASAPPVGDPWEGFPVGAVAVAIGGAWVSLFRDPDDITIPIAPVVGTRAWIQDEKVLAIWTGVAWETITGEAVYAGRCTVNTNFTSAWADIPWGADARVNGGVFGHDTGVDPDEITLKEAGAYLVIANVQVEKIASGAGDPSTASLRLTLNGVAVTGATRDQPLYSTLVQSAPVTLVALVNATAGQILRVQGSCPTDNDFRAAADKTSLTIRRL